MSPSPGDFTLSFSHLSLSLHWLFLCLPPVVAALPSVAPWGRPQPVHTTAACSLPDPRDAVICESTDMTIVLSTVFKLYSKIFIYYLIVRWIFFFSEPFPCLSSDRIRPVYLSLVWTCPFSHPHPVPEDFAEEVSSTAHLSPRFLRLPTGNLTAVHSCRLDNSPSSICPPF